ncbi:DEAD/DEAH box helicase, partial [Myxococcota bacterium]|nr:DEAD/DEAH box helicase [Myxococcota bacterium]
MRRRPAEPAGPRRASRPRASSGKQQRLELPPPRDRAARNPFFPFLLSGSENDGRIFPGARLRTRRRIQLSSALAQPTALNESGFSRFELDSTLIRALNEAGFTEPRPIQAETIPACLEGDDVLGLAQTGTGKTAAFALPILQRLIEEPGRGPLVLVLAPTRELAIQIDAEFRRLARYTDIKTATVFGGVSPRVQMEALRKRPEIV